MSDSIYSDAIARFLEWWEQAKQIPTEDGSAVCLATATADGRVSSRMVLLRGADERGFVFYTNSTSRKGQLLEANPHAALCFYWHQPYRQVRIEGTVEHATTAESDAYWSQRPRRSQIGGWASMQSQQMSNRAEFDRRIAEMTRRFEGLEVPRPEFWHGYRVVPERIEFWQGQDARLHDRDVVEQKNGVWSQFRLFP